MRFMILIRATADSEAGVIPGPEMFEAMIEAPIAHHVSAPSAKKKSADVALAERLRR